jgi:hypothetical protein
MGMIFSTLGELSPGIQSLVIVGLLTILIIAACSRRAAINLVSFLYDLGHVRHRDPSQQPPCSGDDQQRNAGSVCQGDAYERSSLHP